MKFCTNKLKINWDSSPCPLSRAERLSVSRRFRESNPCFVTYSLYGVCPYLGGSVMSVIGVYSH